MKDLNSAVDALEQFVLSEGLTAEQNQKLEEIYLSIQRHVMAQEEKIQELIEKNRDLENELEERKTIIWHDSTMRKQIIGVAITAAHGHI